jgi:hypothetical protein
LRPSDRASQRVFTAQSGEAEWPAFRTSDLRAPETTGERDRHPVVQQLGG